MESPVRQMRKVRQFLIQEDNLLSEKITRRLPPLKFSTRAYTHTHTHTTRKFDQFDFSLGGIRSFTQFLFEWSGPLELRKRPLAASPFYQTYFGTKCCNQSNLWAYSDRTKVDNLGLGIKVHVAKRGVKASCEGPQLSS